jgi:VRR-NUC domain
VNEALVPVLGPSEARRLTNEVKRDAEALWRKLVELYDGGAHTALGYSSWGAYFEVEFGQSGRRGYQLLDAGRVLESVNHGSTAPPNERQARELAPLLDEPEQLRETWAEVRELQAEPTAANVHEAVEKKLASTPPPHKVFTQVKTAQREKDFQKAVTDALNALGWRWYHSRPAQTSKGWRTALSGDAGYPDITAVRRDRILFIELKAQNGRLSEEQGVWLADLGAAGAEAFCWRPSDWPAIEEMLR